MADRYWVAGGTGNYNSTTNWSATSGGASGASVPTTADDVFFNASSGAGTATINVFSNCRSLNLTGFTGTLDFTNGLSVNGTALNFGTGGYTITGTNNLRLLTAITITSNGTTYTGNVEFLGAVTYTLADNMSVSGDVIISGTSARTLNGNTFNILGNLTVSFSNAVLGTTTFVLGGTGTWNHTGTGIIRNNLTINTAGTITLGTNVRYDTGTLTYTTGTVVTTGSTLNIAANTTLNTNGIIWNNISVNVSTTLTLSSNLTLTDTFIVQNSGTVLTITLGGNTLVSSNANLLVGNNCTFNLPANQTFKSFTNSVNTATINNNTLTLTENINLLTQVSGTSTIVYAGTGTWTATAAAATINNNFTINTAGTLTITGNVYKTGGTFTYTAGTIDDTSGAVITGNATTCNVSGVTWTKFLVGGTTTLTSNINAITFGTALNSAISFTLGGNTLNFTNLEFNNVNTTTLPFAWTCQNINFAAQGSATINGFSITINGDLTQSGNGAFTGTTTLNYTGSGTWSQPTGNGRIGNSLTINTAGTLTFTGGSIGGGIFTYTAGTVNSQVGSTLFIRTTSTTINGIINWYDVILGNSEGSGGITSLILNAQLICTNSLTLGLSNTTFSGTDGTFDTYDLILGLDNFSRATQLVSTKTYRVRRSLICRQAANISRVLLRSTTAGSKAIFTVDQGATLDVGFVDATDIDSSLGRRIYSYRGVFTNTDNWSLLPTDVAAPTSGSYVFVN
jgi:hypothetical protein